MMMTTMMVMMMTVIIMVGGRVPSVRLLRLRVTSGTTARRDGSRAVAGGERRGATRRVHGEQSA